MKKLSVWFLAVVTAMLIVGCANQKAPAQQALDQAESSLNQIRDAAMKYAPDQLQSVDAQLNGLKDSFNKGDFKAVLAGAPALTTAIGNLKDATTQKQADAQAASDKAKEAWGSVSSDVPKMVDAIQSRVDILSKSHHLPHGVTKDTLDAAKSGLDSMKSAWSQASQAATSGDFTTAMSKAQAVKDQGTQIMQSLGMKSS